MMEDPMVDIPVRLDKELVYLLNKMTKQQLIERVCSVGVEAKTHELRCQVAIEDVGRANKVIASLDDDVSRLRGCVEQGRRMVTSAMDYWEDI